MKLYTFGYEGIDIRAFLSRLEKAGIRVVVDVRELPLSRKKGFSKRALSDTLADAGIDYCHVPALGCPRHIRDRFKIDGDWTAYSRAFNSYLSSQQKVIEDLVTGCRARTSCLLCFEADFNACHRTYVGRAAVRAGAPELVHLTIKTAIPDAQLRAAA